MSFTDDSTNDQSAASTSPQPAQPVAAQPVAQPSQGAKPTAQPNSGQTQSTPTAQPNNGQQFVSNPGATAQTGTAPTAQPDPNQNHPAVQKAGLLRSIAETLAGGPRFKTTISDDGTPVRQRVPLSRSDIGMAIAMSAITGALSGLQEKGPNATAKAAGAGFNAVAQQRQQTDKEAREAAQEQSNALVRRAQIFETNSRTLLNTAEAEQRGADAIQKQADQNKQIIDDYDANGSLHGRHVTQQELSDGIKSGRFNATDMLGPVDGYRIVGDGKVEATHAIVQDPTAKIPLRQVEYDKFAAAHVPGYRIGVKIPDGYLVKGSMLASANEVTNAHDLAQQRNDEVTNALKGSDDPKIKALADKVPSINSMMDDPKTGAGLVTALSRYQKYVSHSDQHGLDLYDSLQAMAQPTKAGPNGATRNPDAQYANQVASAFGGWDVLKAYHSQVTPLEIKNEGEAADMIASNEPGSRQYKYAQRWMNAQTQQKAAQSKADAQAKQSVESSSTDVQQAAKNVVSGDLSNFKDLTSARGGQRTALFNAIHDEAVRQGKNPNDWSPAALKTKSDLYEDYRQGKTSNNIAAFDAFLGHANDAMDANDAWRRSGSPLINRPLNWLGKNAENDPNYIAFTTSLEPVRKEFMSFLNANRAEHEADLKTMQTVLSDTNSPAQIETALKQLGKSADLRLAAIGRKYQNTMGAPFPNLVSDDGKKTLQRMGIQSKSAPTNQSAAPSTPQFSKLSASGKFGWDGTQWVPTGK